MECFPFQGLMFRGSRYDEERLTDFTSKSMIPYRFSSQWRLGGASEKYIIFMKTYQNTLCVGGYDFQKRLKS